MRIKADTHIQWPLFLKLVAVLVFCLTAHTAKGEELFTQDKANHFSVSALISLSVLSVTKSPEAAFYGTMALGLAKELHDRKQPGNKFSTKDMIFNAAEAALGSGIMPNLRVSFWNGTVYFSNTWAF